MFSKITQSDLKKWEKSSVVLQRPYLVGFYSYSDENCTPAKYMKYFKEPKPSEYPLDLNEGYQTCTFKRHSTPESRLHLPLKYAMSSDTDSKRDDFKYTNVYTSRRVLAKLMEWCYTKYDFILYASRFNGNLFIAGELSVDLFRPVNTHHMRLEQILFADAPDESPKIDKPIDENIGLSSLHRANLGKFNLVYAGEVQGIIADQKLDSFDNEALNKCRFVFTKQMWSTMKKDHKFLMFWIQAYLASIDDIYVAYKNNNGIVEQPIQHIKVDNMSKEFFWKPAVCLGFLNEFLEKVEELMSNVNSLDTVYKFNFNARDKTSRFEIFEGKTKESFIPKSYADFVTK